MLPGDALPIPWEALRPLFKPLDQYLLDPLRDIVVTGTSIEDWQRVTDFLRADRSEAVARVETTFDGVPDDLPESAAETFRRGVGVTVRTTIDLGGVEVRCHYFVADEIEMDFTTTDVREPTDALAVLRFLRALAFRLHRQVHVTEESVREAWWLTFDPVDNTWIVDDWDWTEPRSFDRSDHQRRYSDTQP